jgi:hypothetical protein
VDYKLRKDRQTLSCWWWGLSDHAQRRLFQKAMGFKVAEQAKQILFYEKCMYTL